MIELLNWFYERPGAFFIGSVFLFIAIAMTGTLLAEIIRAWRSKP